MGSAPVRKVGLVAKALGIPTAPVEPVRRRKQRARPRGRPTDVLVRLEARPTRWRFVKAVVARRPGRAPGDPRPGRRTPAMDQAKAARRTARLRERKRWGRT